jgi:hypothetical protein
MFEPILTLHLERWTREYLGVLYIKYFTQCYLNCKFV